MTARCGDSRLSRAAALRQRKERAAHFFGAHFSKFFFADFSVRVRRCAICVRTVRERVARRARFSHVEKMRVFPVILHALKFRTRRAALVRAPCDGLRRAPRRAAVRAQRRVFPSKTQEFTCRICGNAYYDRMKRVNGLPVVKSAGD
jgi:hypothetical protein